MPGSIGRPHAAGGSRSRWGAAVAILAHRAERDRADRTLLDSDPSERELGGDAAQRKSIE